MENMVLIGFELRIFCFIDHLFLYLFPMEASNAYLNSEVPGQKTCYLCVSWQLVVMGAKERSNLMSEAAHILQYGPRIQVPPAQIRMVVLILFL